ncbi:MAG TPA: Gldg family protein [Stellaceae bacterium]|nr:Gldg family protein [Stellaceae bacterium]
MRRTTASLAALGLALAVVLFFSVNSLSDRFLRGSRADLTDQQLYTVSDGTKAVLSKIDEPITLKYFYSSRLGELVPGYGVYAQRVRELLLQYADLARGKIKLDIYDPQPFSDTEDQATALGLQGVSAEEGGEPVYFGLAGSNSTDDSETIPFFSQDREKFLEYDITKLVQSLAFPKKKVVGMISSIPVDADPMARMQGRQSEPQTVITQLRQDYEVRDLSQNVEHVPDDVDVLMIVQPIKLPPKTEYAIDQFVLNGGHALVFVDPNSEFARAHPSAFMPQQGPSAAQFDTLLKAWGVELVKDKIVGDRSAARTVNAGANGRSEPADYLGWLNLKQDDINASDPVTGRLGQMNLATAGVLQPLKDAKTKFDWLLRSSANSELIDVSKVQGRPDVIGLLTDFKATGDRYTMAARITGPAETAFPDGPPKDDKPDAKPGAKVAPPEAQIKTAKQPIDVILVADTDMLDDRFWVRVQEFAGRQEALPTANNGDFVQNAVDNLIGTGDLIGLRSRGSAARPFLLVDDMQREAQSRYQAHARELQDKLRDTQAKLADVKGEPDADGNISLTPDQQKAVDQFRVQIIQTRQELRQVKLALRQNIDFLKLRLAALDIGLVPALLAIVAVVVGIVRQRRRRIRSPSG